ncbi:hypothetical protein IM774_04490 [Erysipelotrichaceae bacterium RD49]|nr:hypothetical protein [Erysipelotrichaceae bacterium RD49]
MREMDNGLNIGSPKPGWNQNSSQKTQLIKMMPKLPQKAAQSRCRVFA